MGCLSHYFLVLAFLCGLTQGQQLIAEQPPIISEFLNIVNHIIELPSDGFVIRISNFQHQSLLIIRWLIHYDSQSNVIKRSSIAKLVG